MPPFLYSNTKRGQNQSRLQFPPICDTLPQKEVRHETVPQDLSGDFKCLQFKLQLLPRHKAQAEEFSRLLPKLRPYTDFLYFHLMGEPLCHPDLEVFLRLAGEAGFKVILTTNGTLLARHQQMLLASPALHKVNISLHAFEANDLSVPFEAYLRDCFRFGQAAQGKKLICYRLWNHGGAEELNARILADLRSCFPAEWVHERRGIRIADKVYLEDGDKFDWPDLSAPAVGEHVFCYGLKDQIGVLFYCRRKIVVLLLKIQIFPV